MKNSVFGPMVTAWRIAPTDGDDATVLLRVADERMYRDRSTGSGRRPATVRKTEQLFLDG